MFTLYCDCKYKISHNIILLIINVYVQKSGKLNEKKIDPDQYSSCVDIYSAAQFPRCADDILDILTNEF